MATFTVHRTPHSNDDLDWSADRKTELAVRPPPIDGDFGKSGSSRAIQE
jgi:hypothetical protein